MIFYGMFYRHALLEEWTLEILVTKSAFVRYRFHNAKLYYDYAVESEKLS